MAKQFHRFAFQLRVARAFASKGTKRKRVICSSAQSKQIKSSHLSAIFQYFRNLDVDVVKGYTFLWSIALTLFIIGIIKKIVGYLKTFQALVTSDIAIQFLVLTFIRYCPNWSRNFIFGIVQIILGFAAILVIQMLKNVLNVNQNNLEENKMTEHNPDVIEEIENAQV